MTPARLPGGWFRRLWLGDEAALLAHYRRLAPADLRRRFLHTVGDAWLVRQSARVGERGYHVIGWFCDGALRGVSEIAVAGRDAEAAFSVEGAWRNRGAGRALMRRALGRARLARCRSLTVYTSADNMPMLRIAREFGARIRIEEGDAVGVIAPAAAGPAEMTFELVENRIGLVAAAGELAFALFGPSGAAERRA